MLNWLECIEFIFGEEEMLCFRCVYVFIVGLGGIGLFVGEFIVCVGVGIMIIIDGDVFDFSNKNW